MKRSDLAAARARLQRGGSIVSFSGAGLSAESGVPTFRDAASGGLWDKYDPMELASPEGFARDPDLVLQWYRWRRGLVAQAKPNAAHHALAARDDIIHVTQNVDDLLHRAGAAPEQVLQVHGSIATDRCHRECGFSEKIDLTDPPDRRACPACAAPLRPGVVWFGEALPQDILEAAAAHCRNAEVLLVIGTSATVYPAAGLIDVARGAGALIIVINTEASGASHLADVELIGKAGDLIPDLLGEGTA